MGKVQTSNLTSAGTDLNITPASGKNLKITAGLDTNNPGETPLSTTSSTGVVKRLDMNNLDALPLPPDAGDWLLCQDTSDSAKIKKLSTGSVTRALRSVPLDDPGVEVTRAHIWLAEPCTLRTEAGGSGTTADLQNSLEFRVNTGVYSQSDKAVVSGDKIEVRWISSKLDSASDGDTVSGKLLAVEDEEIFSQVFNLVVDETPETGWSSTASLDQPVSTGVYSMVFMPKGINIRTAYSIDGGTLSNISIGFLQNLSDTADGVLQGEGFFLKGTTGASYSTDYTAIITVGTVQHTWTVTTAPNADTVVQPRIATPINGAENVYGDNTTYTVTSTPYQVIGSAGTHAQSDWELSDDNGVVLSSTADTTNLVSWPIAESSLVAGTKYYVRVKHRSNYPLDSAWSNFSEFTYKQS